LLRLISFTLAGITLGIEKVTLVLADRQKIPASPHSRDGEHGTGGSIGSDDEDECSGGWCGWYDLMSLNIDGTALEIMNRALSMTVVLNLQDLGIRDDGKTERSERERGGGGGVQA
jgi:hypothetical protein